MLRDKEEAFGVDRVQPQAVDMERAVLGAMLIDQAAIGAAAEILDETAFYRTAHRHIFEAILSLFERDEPADMMTVTEELNRRNHLDEVDGPVYVATLATDVATAGNVESYAGIVREKALRRKLITSAAELTTECYEDPGDVFEILDRAEQRLYSLSERRARKGFEAMESIVHRAMEEIDDAHENRGVSGVPTGYRDLDELLTGLRKSDLIILAGRTSMGKTAMALGIARNVAVQQEVPVGMFSLEMSSVQLAQRLLSAEARLDSRRIRLGKLNDDEWSRLGLRVGSIASAPIYVDDSATLSCLEMRTKARRLRSEKGIRLLVVDYLQLMSSDGRAESRTQEVSKVSRALKALAKELDIPVLALSQLSRQVDNRGGGRPKLSDLRESGSIEQDADVVLFVHRPEVFGVEEDDDGVSTKGMAEIIIGKQRNGPLGKINLTWVDDYARFENPEVYQEPPRF